MSTPTPLRVAYSGPSLSDVLAQLGYTHEPGGFGGRVVRRPDGGIVGKMTCTGCWRHLEEQGLVDLEKRPGDAVVVRAGIRPDGVADVYEVIGVDNESGGVAIARDPARIILSIHPSADLIIVERGFGIVGRCERADGAGAVDAAILAEVIATTPEQDAEMAAIYDRAKRRSK